MKQGEIVVLDFPHSNMAQSKIRPAVVLSNEQYNRFANVVLAGIYSNEQPLSISISSKDMQRGKLRKDSYISLQNIFSTDRSAIRASIGALNDRKVKETLVTLKKYF